MTNIYVVIFPRNVAMYRGYSKVVASRSLDEARGAAGFENGEIRGKRLPDYLVICKSHFWTQLGRYL